MEEIEQETPENEDITVESSEESNPELITLDSEDKNSSDGEEKSLSEDELDKRKNKTQNRINELTRRRREAEEREVAALEYADAMKRKAEGLQSRVDNTDAGYATEFEARVSSQAEQARSALEEATEANDPKRIAAATAAMAQVEIEKERVRLYKGRVKQQSQTQKNIPEYQAPQRSQAPAAEPDPKAVAWADNNDWFGEDRKLTSVAIGLHSDLINEGFDGSSNDYYQELNNRLKPWLGAAGHETDVSVETNSTKTSPVASVTSGRSVAKKSKTVKLSKSQLEIAKKLGVPKEEYAKEVVKLQGNRS
tara:strand:+ start:1075 stop:1998 length:924 start_codon:yes stop_codon:yes gene_type:complete